ncbi:MAG: LuxR C-terminal-related transcriptional regulator [Acidobacteriota bacterium]
MSGERAERWQDAHHWDVKTLRAHFLDRHRGRVGTRTLDAVGHALLEIDRTDRVLAIGMSHLGDVLQAGRVDVGFGAPRHRFYTPVAEWIEDEGERPSMVGIRLPNTHDILQRVWRSRVPVAYDDVPNNPLCQALVDEFAATSSRAMLVQRLDAGGESFGCACVDDLDHGRTWKPSEHEYLHRFCVDFFAPILAISRQLSAKRRPDKPSPAELEVIRFAAHGLSYKEIAVALEKSVRTVEAQLRSARQKTGATNQAELVRLCAHWL